MRRIYKHNTYLENISLLGWILAIEVLIALIKVIVIDHSILDGNSNAFECSQCLTTVDVR